MISHGSKLPVRTAQGRLRQSAFTASGIMTTLFLRLPDSYRQNGQTNDSMCWGPGLLPLRFPFLSPDQHCGYFGEGFSTKALTNILQVFIWSIPLARIPTPNTLRQAPKKRRLLLWSKQEKDCDSKGLRPLDYLLIHCVVLHRGLGSAHRSIVI